MLVIRHLKVVASSNEKRTVQPPVRLPNSKYRTREYLTEAEVKKLIKAAGENRQGHRDSTMILLAFRHGLRVSELVDLRWVQVDLDNAMLHVRIVKHGTPATHPLTGVELRALRKLQRETRSRHAVRVCQRAPGAVHQPRLPDASRASRQEGKA